MDQLHQAHEKDRQAHKEQLDKLLQEHSSVQNKTAEQIEKLQKEKESLQKKLDQGELEGQAIAYESGAGREEGVVRRKSARPGELRARKSAQSAAALRGQVETQKARLIAEAKTKGWNLSIACNAGIAFSLSGWVYF